MAQPDSCPRKKQFPLKLVDGNPSMDRGIGCLQNLEATIQKKPIDQVGCHSATGTILCIDHQTGLPGRQQSIGSSEPRHSGTYDHNIQLWHGTQRLAFF
jgi:hypothetical protein